MTDTFDAVLADDLAQEIRRIDGDHSLGAGALADALIPFLSQRIAAAHAAEVAELQRIIREHFSRAEREMTDRFHAETRAEAAERDARRYRWLRERLAAEELTDEDVAIFALRTVGPIVLRPADDDDLPSVDAAIDAAIATTEQADD